MAIPCLPEPARQEVMIAYLLFRIADTLEDGEELDRDEKLAALERLAQLLRGIAEVSPEDGIPSAMQLDLPRPPSRHSDYMALVTELPRVLQALIELRPTVRSAIISSVLTTLDGMGRFIAAGTPAGKIEIASLMELREYCYFVAGVVGEMLTEVFIQTEASLESTREELMRHARWFGEGLQLVNILKDADDDCQSGRLFIPSGVSRSQLFDLARQDLRHAETYIRSLKRAGAARDFIVFTELPLLLAWRTLECVEKFGAGSKVPRSEVMMIVAETVAQQAS